MGRQRRPFNKYLDCNECGGYVSEQYMVLDSVWKESGLEKRGGVLHLGCLEKLIGRKLTVDDLKKVPINGLAFYLLSRETYDAFKPVWFSDYRGGESPPSPKIPPKPIMRRGM